MAYTSAALSPRDFAFPALPAPAKQHSLWRLAFDALMESRQHQAEHEIERYLAGTGGKFTDEVEREIERRFLSNPPRW